MLWFTGLSGAGKSTLALALERELFAKGYHVYVLDGDNIRSGPQRQSRLLARRTGPRTSAASARSPSLFADAGFIVITLVHLALPLRPRAGAGRGQGRVPRDLRQGLARRLRGRAIPRASTSARATGEIPEFTGISSPYEAPERPDLVVPTDELPIEDCLAELIRFVEERLQA